ncbi:helix-turn-helix domain-containing protein [Streptomyces sp. NPDC017936]|uniref:helix-turn-helix domain-containing protein n=1 Tax=Streptomyces sp. NPDC017936 TaxID=3365016 RepID=UPI0037B4B1A2
MTQQQSWSERLARGVARELRRHRERRGLSAQELADSCAALGMPIQRSVIANFENGRRASIGVAELLVFAAVLKIPPVWLIAPMGFESSFEILPGSDVDPYASAAWISGEHAQSGEEEVYGDNPVPLCDDLIFLMGQIEECREKVEEIRPVVERVAPELDQIEEQLAQLRREFFRHAEKQKDILNQVKELEAQERLADSTNEMFAEADRSYKLMTECNEKMEALVEKKSELAQSRSNLEVYLSYQADYERDAREVINEFRAKGWLPPKIPESLAYLLEEPKREAPLQVPARRRKRGQ